MNLLPRLSPSAALHVTGAGMEDGDTSVVGLTTPAAHIETIPVIAGTWPERARFGIAPFASLIHTGRVLLLRCLAPSIESCYLCIKSGATAFRTRTPAVALRAVRPLKASIYRLCWWSCSRSWTGHRTDYSVLTRSSPSMAVWSDLRHHVHARASVRSREAGM